MNSTKMMPIGHGVVVALLAALLLILAACGSGEPPDLVIPTPAITAAVPTGEATSDVTQPTTAPSAIAPTPTLAGPQPTATLPPVPTVAPPLPTSASGPSPTVAAATAAPSATSAPVAEAGYRVAFVAANDTLNVRRQPNPDAGVVTRLPADASGIAVIGEGETIRGGSLWLPVETAAGDGWVNSRFLTESVTHEAFCADPAITDLINRFEAAVAEEDGRALRDLVHSDRGLRLRLNWWNNEVIVAGEDIQTLFRAQKKYDWGINEGSGEKIRGSFSDVMEPFLERDLLGASEWACDQGLFGGTAGSTVLPEGYEAVRFFSAHRPAPAEQELDWGTWLIGIEHWEGQYYISYLVHYRWEI